MIKEIVKKNRSYRRFQQDGKVTKETLMELVDLGRLSACTKNMQVLKYFLINEEEKNEVIFPYLKWAGYLKDWDGPKKGERPSAYIVIVWDKNIPNSREFVMCDLGIASQSILLGATEKGLGGCMIYAFNRKGVSESFNIDEQYEPLLVIALGQPKEEVIIDEIEKDADIKYWRDNNHIHHVPKRKLNDIIIE